MLTTRTPAAHRWALQQFQTFRSNGLFAPLSVGKKTVVFPGFDGGAEWGGSAADVNSGVIYLNANDVPWTGELVESRLSEGLGSSVYQSQCAVCHGIDRKGSPPTFPSLEGVEQRLSRAAITNIVRQGKGRMPAFPGIEQSRLTALLAYLKTGSDPGEAPQQHTRQRASHAEVSGANLYARRCAFCHGGALQGAPPTYPALLGVRERLSDQQIRSMIHSGKGGMPAFPDLSAADVSSLLRFLSNSQSPQHHLAPSSDHSSKREVVSSSPAQGDTSSKYQFTGYHKFVDPGGYPAVTPPWGTLNAIDLNTGQYLWRLPLGEYPELAAQGMKNTGSENYGGPIATAGGLVFIGATIYDRKLRAFDSRTGDLLWSAVLPYAGTATPATYMIDGRQYVVIATSGQRDPKGPQGSAYVAFALP
jgi:mono/diheme cytochrome c family protein